MRGTLSRQSESLTPPLTMAGERRTGEGWLMLTGVFPAHRDHLQGCPTFWRLWATMEEELSWTTH